MDSALFRFPVKCPCCDRESLVASSLATVADTLATGRRLSLVLHCENHRVMWAANEIERDQIREYAAALHFSMGEKYFSMSRQPLRPSPRTNGAKPCTTGGYVETLRCGQA